MSALSFATRPKPVVLCVLDGWGYRQAPQDNATAQAELPVFRRYWQACPHALLQASGPAVGLPEGQMGNSEVGHMNLGAGRVVLQDLPMIENAIAKGALASNPALNDLIARLKASNGTCHVMGLASPGGVHAHQKHIVALTKQLFQAGVPVAVHAFLDGRDTPPQSAGEHIAALLAELAPLQNVHLATLCGRYYAMDRDNRWDRVQKAYALLTNGKGQPAADPLAAIQASYAANVTDEFALPVALNGYTGMKDGDGVLFANFRTDRAREILLALLDPDFAGFAREKTLTFAGAVGMVSYSERLDSLMKTLFPPKALNHMIGQVVAQAGLKQLRIAETEKYPHVTFFFNGGREEPYPNETRILVPSPKVATYDQQPEMAAYEVTDRLVAAIDSGAFDFIVVNYANPDMVGHTGSLKAAIAALEAVDRCLGRLFEAVEKAGGVALVTADHGNCETMMDPVTQGPHTAHTLAPVPALLVNAPEQVKKLRQGKLADVAPTLLDLLRLPKPAEMDGESLLDG